MVKQLTSALSRIEGLLDPIPAAILLLVGIPLMLIGAEWLVRGSVAIARQIGVSTLIVGLTVVSAGTSAPELAINVIAAAGGHTGLSFGNVVGSNIANIGLVIGIGALIAPIAVHSRVLRIELPWVVIISLTMIMVALVPLRWKGGRDVGTEASRDPETASLDASIQQSADAFAFGFGWIDGLLLLAGFLAFTVFWYRTCKDEKDDPLTKEAVEQVEVSGARGIASASVLFIAGLIGLLLGGKLTEVGAIRSAAYFDLSHAVVGMTVIAVSTSLPELVTTIIACRKGYTDLAMGNIVGSNIFNILLVLGTTALIADVPVPSTAGWQDLIAMAALTLVLWWIAAIGRPQVARLAGGILLASYVGYIFWSIIREAAVA